MKDEAALEGDSGDDSNENNKDKQLHVKKKKGKLEKTLMGLLFDSVLTMFFPLLVGGLGTIFKDQAEEIENTEPDKVDTSEEEDLASDMEKDNEKLNQEEKKQSKMKKEKKN